MDSQLSTLNSQLGSPPPPFLRTECAWCGAFLGLKLCAPAQAGQVSHGICQPCAQKQLRDIDAYSFQPRHPIVCKSVV